MTLNIPKNYNQNDSQDHKHSLGFVDNNETLLSTSSLTDMQKAYLLARQNVLPLSGVSMHDFREFRGKVDANKLRLSLKWLINKHQCLRSTINSETLRNQVWSSASIPLTVIDHSSGISSNGLNTMLACQADVEEVLVQDDISEIERIVSIYKILRTEYSHLIHSLDQPLWQICLWQLPNTIFSSDLLPDSEEDSGKDTLVNDENPAFSSVLFVSFDGLMFDGYAISKLLNELFHHVQKMEQTEQSTDNRIDKQTTTLTSKKTQPTTNMLSANANELFYLNKPVDKDYWMQKLSNIHSVINLPWSTNLDDIKKSSYARESLIISQKDLLALSKLAAKNKLFPNSLLTTVVLVTLAELSQDNCALVSLPISNSHSITELSNHSSFIVLEHCNQTKKTNEISQKNQNNPLGANHTKHKHYTQEELLHYCQSVQTDILQAMQHCSYSGVELSKYLLHKTGQVICLPVAITNGMDWTALDIEQTDTQYIRYHSGLTQTPQLALDIRLSLTAKKDLSIDIDYATQALTPLFIQQLLMGVQQLIKQLINQLTDISPRSKSLTSGQMNIKNMSSTTSDIQASTIQDQDETMQGETKKTTDNKANEEIKVHDYLADIYTNLSEKSSKTALIFGNEKISYQTLGEHVARVIKLLQVNQVQPGQVTAIYLDKSPEYIYCVLACALQGIIWVPIDMGAPSNRVEYLLSNCHAEFILGYKKIATSNWYQKSQRNNQLSLIAIDNLTTISEEYLTVSFDELTTNYFMDDRPAYYLYTSGSTGKPKCVVLNNKATANVMEQTIDFWKIRKDDIFMAVTPFHHDISMFDLFAGLSMSATLVLPTPLQAKSATDWANMVVDHKITVWCSVPAIIDMLLTCATDEQLQSIRLISQGGDYIKPHVIKRLRKILPHATFMSFGGPTETTIWSIWHEISSEDQKLIPYGKEVKNNRYYILDENHKECPKGKVGSIVMTGVNLSNGYLLDGKLHQSDFITLLEDGKPCRAFVASDQGYMREDGNIIFVGRSEGYLKVRGVRIASLDVEQAIAKHSKIRSSVVFCIHNPKYDMDELIAVYESVDNETLRITELRNFLKADLPLSHIPSRWLQIDQLPLTRNCKLDRSAIKKWSENKLYQ